MQYDFQNAHKIIISLCDESGTWSGEYAKAGYTVLRIDPQYATRQDDQWGVAADGARTFAGTAAEFIEWLTMPRAPFGPKLQEWEYLGYTVQGVMCAPPCTDFSVSGAQYWPAKDANGTTAAALQIVQECLAVVDLVKPEWWVLENPVGRLPKLLPAIGKPWYFQPHWFGDAYTKKTGLWGSFCNALTRNDVEPIRSCKQGSWLQQLGGKSEKTKRLRSATPPGFSAAFFTANP